jgi:hypothetical protein
MVILYKVQKLSAAFCTYSTNEFLIHNNSFLLNTHILLKMHYQNISCYKNSFVAGEPAQNDKSMDYLVRIMIDHK